jgi:hypothetical protein
MSYEAEHLGSGVVVFRKVVEVDQDFLIPYIAELHKKVVAEDFTIIHDDDGKAIYAINRSGHRYDIETINDVNRIMGFATEDKESVAYKFFNKCESEIYQCLLRYVEQYPLVLPSLWWREQGHIVAYSPHSSMGFHSDNDVNYQPDAIPDFQLATRHVVGCIIYLNDSVKTNEEITKYEYTGGELDFKYLDIQYEPKTGDIIFFPSNYMASHKVRDITSGSRYAYISYFSHGSQDAERGISPGPKTDKIISTQVWMPEIFDDYKKYISEKYGNELHNYPDLTLPFSRFANSSGTKDEVLNEKSRNQI